MAVVNHSSFPCASADASEPIAPIQSTCGHWLRVGNLLAQKCFDQAFEGTGLTSIQCGALQIIASQPGLGHQHLAARLHTAPSVMTTALKPLSLRKLISRQQADLDGRALVYALTPAGQRLVLESQSRLATAESALQQRLDHDEQEQLKRLLMKLVGVAST